MSGTRERGGAGRTRSVAHAATICAATLVLFAGCNLFSLLGGSPTARLNPPPGRYDEAVHVNPADGYGERFYWTDDENATIDEFVRMGEIYIAGDTTFWYYAVDTRGKRSAIIEAEYEIDDRGTPEIDVPDVWRASADYYSMDIRWARIPPDDFDPDQFERESPWDDITEWNDLEYAVYSSKENDIDFLAAARENGTLEMSWVRETGGFRYRASRPGEGRFFNVFVRDLDGNAAPYGTRWLASLPALSVYIGIGMPADDEVRVHDAQPGFTPGFTPRPVLFGPLPYNRTRAVALGRIDGDIREDLAIVVSDGSNDEYHWYSARPDGSFVAGSPQAIVHTDGSASPRVIAIADINDDGSSDLVFNTDGRDILAKSTTGALLASIPAGNAESFRLGDLNNDGLPDIVSWGYGATFENLRVWVNNDGSSFSEVSQPWSGTNGPDGQRVTDVEIADLDRDGDLDLAVSNDGTWPPFPPVNLAYGNGTGSFVESTSEDVWWPFDHWTKGIAAADYNRDGWPDLFFSNGNPPSQVYTNDGAGGFYAGPVTSSPDAGLDAVAADMNGDGFPDIVQNTSVDLEVWLNDNGFGIAATPVTFATGVPRFFAVGQVR